MATVTILKRATGKSHTETVDPTADSISVAGVVGNDDGNGITVGAPGAGANTGSALQAASFTTTQRDNLIPANGMVIYNTTTSRIEVYQNGAWTSPNTQKLHMVLGGPLDVPTLPLTEVGTELAADDFTATIFAARRAVAGASGTTTVQLEVNGSPISGATLSWSGGVDADQALKTVAISQAISTNDRVSFRLTAAEPDSETIVGYVQ